MKKLVAVLAGVLLLLPSLTLALEPFNKDLKYGMMKNAEVKRMQEFLRDEGVYKGGITGNFYTLTREAVRKYQKNNGLKVTGLFDMKTRSKVNEMSVAVNDAAPTNYIMDTTQNIPVGWVSNGDGTWGAPEVKNLPNYTPVINQINNYPQLNTSPETPTNTTPNPQVNSNTSSMETTTPKVQLKQFNFNNPGMGSEGKETFEIITGIDKVFFSFTGVSENCDFKVTVNEKSYVGKGSSYKAGLGGNILTKYVEINGLNSKTEYTYTLELSDPDNNLEGGKTGKFITK